MMPSLWHTISALIVKGKIRKHNLNSDPFSNVEAYHAEAWFYEIKGKDVDVMKMYQLQLQSDICW